MRIFSGWVAAFIVVLSAKWVAITALTGSAALFLGIPDWRTFAYPVVWVLWLLLLVWPTRMMLGFFTRNIKHMYKEQV